MIYSLPLFISLTVGSTSVNVAAMPLGLLLVGLVLDTAISDALVVSFNFGLTLHVLLNQRKCVHWISSGRVFYFPFLRAVCVSLIWEMNESVPPSYLQPLGVERWATRAFLFIVAPTTVFVNTCRLASCRRQSHTPLGRDCNPPCRRTRAWSR